MKKLPSQRVFALLLTLIFAAGWHTQTLAEGADSRPSGAETAGVEQVDINRASAGQLADVLDGVGAVKARAIVDYREDNGGFDSPQELLAVDGIGEATLKKNRDRLAF